MIELGVRVLDEAGLARLAEALALKCAAGDCFALHGDLGAGKTTFARAFIRAMLADPDAEVPSPTFPIEQRYETPRGPLAHFDLYRLTGPDDIAGIGFEETAAAAMTLVEWPDRAGDLLPPERIDVTLDPGPTRDTRRLTLAAAPASAPRARRALAIADFLAAHAPWSSSHIVHLHGDASVRSYARLLGPGAQRAVLMDAPRQPSGPPIRDGLPYSRIARLAEDVRPFVAISAGLRASGLGATEVLAHDLDAGLLVVSDLGDNAFATAIARGARQTDLIAATVDVLVALRARPFPTTLPLPDGTAHTLPRFDRAALEIETELILDWYVPAMTGAPASDDMRAAFRRLWAPLLDRMRAEPPGLFLRDVHSPNLFWRPERTGLDRVGLIDFQDALAEPWAYDVASLLQDARMDVPADIEQAQLARYGRLVAAREPAFDAEAFAATYAVFGAQRNTRLVGLWVRLLVRDGKPGYLAHLPRTWDYLSRNLAHPVLAPLRAYYDANFPQDMRRRLPRT